MSKKKKLKVRIPKLKKKTQNKEILILAKDVLLRMSFFYTFTKARLKSMAMQTKLNLSFLPGNLEINTFEDVKPFYEDLLQRRLTTPKEVRQWMAHRSELESVLEEDLAWRYIKMNCDTENEGLAEHFNRFISTIEPEISKQSNALNKRVNQDEVLKLMDLGHYFIPIREIKKEIEIFREENVELEAQLQAKEQEYGVVASKMSIQYSGEEMTLQKAANFLKETDRDIRKEVYELINNRRLQDAQKLNLLLDELIILRHKIARNAGYNNYRNYKFKAMGRFDYTVDDTEQFHDSVAKSVVPLVDTLLLQRKKELGHELLKPYDLDVDTQGKAPLKVFETADDLVGKTIRCFADLDPEMGVYLNEMKKMGHLDLDSRKGKAPGGFNYPLHYTNVPFIFMNATGNIRDMVTMLHEGGHAVHSFLTAKLELVDFKECPSEVAELASMTMELITMDYWHHFFGNEDDLKRAKRTHLEDVLSVLPWVATIDKFQHYLYLNPTDSHEQRKQAWVKILDEFGSKVVDYSGYEDFRDNAWQKQLHIFEVPFYYIEYGIAQLGAIGIWKNFKENPTKALDQYKAALKLGYTEPIPIIYETAGIRFDFSEEYIAELMQFVQKELDALD
jgi:oligoendopeptidase F